MSEHPKPRVYYRGTRWCIDQEGYAGLWAWHNTLQGAIYEAIQLYVLGYRDRTITGERFL